MRAQDVEDIIKLGLEGTDWERVAFLHGQDDSNAPPGRFVLITRLAGAGLSVEGLFDRPGWQITAVGEQYDYADSESMADQIDAIMLNARGQQVNDLYLLQIDRQGGSPAPLQVDDADRTRFVCSYITEVESLVA